MTELADRSEAGRSYFKIRDSVALKALALIALLYLFILSVTLLGGSFKLFGKGFVDAMFQATSNPIVGLFIGVIVTAIIQSSSTTTSLIVGLVGSGALSFEHAIPMVMGANIGTTITNTIVSMAHISRDAEFRRAFAGATVHDFFNVSAVIVLLPLQVRFNLIGASAHWVESLFEGFGGMEFISPLGAITKPVSEQILATTGDSGWLGAAIAFLLLFLALRYIVRLLKSMVLARVEKFFQRYVFRTAALSFLLGATLTAVVQSSSITSSVVIPLVGAGVITLQQIYPYLLGANMGTTITALLASFATGSSEAVAVAFAHLVFNSYGIVLFWPLKKIPIYLATSLSEATQRSKLIPLAFVAIVFFLVPGILIYLMR